jgi:general secretion pathway protein I
LTSLQTKQTGFSLLEVLVAFVVLALVLGVLMQIFSGGIRNTNRAAQHQQAILLAKSKLASVGIEIPLKVGKLTGRFDQRFQWKLDITRHEDDALESYNRDNDARPLVPIVLLNTSIEVFWDEADAAGSIKLQTLKIARIQ